MRELIAGVTMAQGLVERYAIDCRVLSCYDRIVVTETLPGACYCKFEQQSGALDTRRLLALQRGGEEVGEAVLGIGSSLSQRRSLTTQCMQPQIGHSALIR